MAWDGVIRWPSLCGRSDNNTAQDIFWDYDNLMNTSSPDLPRCFQVTVLTWVPCGFLWLMLPFYSVYLYSLRHLYQPWYKTKVNSTKIALSILLFGVSLADLVWTLSRETTTSHPPLALYLDPAIRAATFVLSAVLTHFVYSVGIHSSGVLFCFWILQVLLNIVQFRSRILKVQENQGEIEDKFHFITFYIFYGLVLVSFLLEFVADIRPEDELTDDSGPDETTPLLGPRRRAVSFAAASVKPCPELKSTFFGLLTHWWVTRWLIKGYKRPLVFEDLPAILPRDDSSLVVDQFYEVWDEEVLLKEKPSLLKALIHTCPGYLAIAAVLKLINVFGVFGNPLLLRVVIDWVTSEDPFVWKGYVLAALLLSINLLNAVIYHQFYKYAYISAYRMRSALTCAIYRKALRLSSATRRTTTVGEIVNLMSVDTQKIHDVASEIHELWAAPLTLGLAIYFLWSLVGAASLAALGFMILMAPLNGYVLARRFAQLQGEQMKHKDMRIKRTNELLNGIKVLKMYAWENAFATFIKDVRADELKCVKHQAYYGVLMFVLWIGAPFLAPLCIFVTYILSSPDRGLDPQTAFVTINLTGLLTGAFSFLPIFTAFAAQAYVSVKRISAMLLQSEVDPSSVDNKTDTFNAVAINNGTFSWGNEEEGAVLKNISLDVPEGSLVAVVGTVGSGKSSLVSALLGEMEVMSGTVNVKGLTAYIPQQAWIQNATLKSNILFGRPLRSDQYKEIVNACALAPDLEIFPAGDETEIGEKGINLSGGQKQRVSLARALYQNNDVYLLDDPLSAVDAHVGKHIFDNVIGPKGLLKTKTRVLVTHGVTYLPQCDLIVVMRGGQVSETGTYQELLQQDGAFAEFLKQYLTNHQEDDQEVPDLAELERQLSALSDGATNTTGSESEMGAETTLKRRHTKATSRQVSHDAIKDEELKPKKNVLIEAEEAEVGSVRFGVLKDYARALTMSAVGVNLVFSLIYAASMVGTNLWLSAWADDPVVNGTQQNTSLRLGVYAGLGFVQVLGIFGSSLAIVLGGVLASKKLHARLLEQIIRAPMSFFDTTPLGRIINRFSTDIDRLDNNIPSYLRSVINNIATLIATITAICYSTPIFLAVVVPLAFLYAISQRVYITSVRQMKRIDSIRKSPIYVNFDETLVGVISVRAFRREEDFVEKNDKLMNDSVQAWYPIVIAQRWLGFFLDVMGALIVFFATVFAVLARGTITGGLVGLSINFAMQTTGVISFLIRNTTELETNIVSAERIKEYSEVPQEKPWEIEETKPRAEWPDRGVVQFENYSSRYRPGLDLVLKNLSFSVNKGEKVGIAGRTGAGKSSVTLGLFRIIEPVTGNIIIDGIDVTKIGLHDLRSRLTIIPQDPVLFSGSLRTNLDPLSAYSDDQIWDVLHMAHLKTFVSGLNAGLAYEVGEGGEALSVGQRQLVCLARALLRRSLILILDEATAAVDLETDDLIQTTIRAAFKDCTVLTIAHRLNTIMDYDRVLVLDQGEIQEFDKPQTLLDDDSSIFHGMAKNAGII